MENKRKLQLDSVAKQKMTLILRPKKKNPKKTKGSKYA